MKRQICVHHSERLRSELACSRWQQGCVQSKNISSWILTTRENLKIATNTHTQTYTYLIKRYESTESSFPMMQRGSKHEIHCSHSDETLNHHSQASSPPFRLLGFCDVPGTLQARVPAEFEPAIQDWVEWFAPCPLPTPRPYPARIKKDINLL